MGCRSLTRAGKRYSGRVLRAMMVYAVTLFSVEYAMKHLHPGFAGIVVLSVLPSLPIVAVLVIIGLYLREERDEFQRDLTMQTLLWGMAGTLAVTTTYGFIEQFAHVRHFVAYWVFILFWCFTGIARTAYSLRYRGPADDE